MSSTAPEAGGRPLAAVLRTRRVPRRVSHAARRLETLPPSRVLAPLVVVQWLAVVALGLSVGHNGWIFYQGGDQLWYYTTGWLLVHGHMPYALVSYGWSTVLAPFAAVFGPNFAQALPAIVALQVVVLVPAAVVASYGIGERLGGRLFGYWLALLWLVVPFVGILYTNTGYHQRYTEVTLPQGLGLTGMADFPSMVLLLVSGYFLLRVLQGGTWADAALAGLVGGVSIGFKPSGALYLVGVGLALLWARRWRGATFFVLGLAPSVLMLTVWKWRGLGYLPILHSSTGAPVRLAAGAGGGPAALVGFGGHYVDLDWHHLQLQLDSIREHFWSARVVEWLPIAGAIGLARASRPAALLFGGWFFAFVFVKGTFAHASIEDSSLLRLMLQAAPAFVVLLGSLPLLLPHAPRRIRASTPHAWGTRRLHAGLLATGLAAFVVAPLGLAAAATPLTPSDAVSFVVSGNVPIPVDASLHVDARAAAGGIRLTWSPVRPRGGRMFYRLLRSPAGTAPDCPDSAGAANCLVNMDVVGTTHASVLRDRPGAGTWTYRVAAAANWLDDPTQGDAYILSRPVTVSVR